MPNGGPRWTRSTDRSASHAAPAGLRGAHGRAAGDAGASGGGTHEDRLTGHPRVLLIEHVDAIGAAAVDASARAIALRAAGADVELAVLEDRQEDDLLYDSFERAPRQSHSRHTGPQARRSLARTVRESGADRIVWAGAAPGGGEAAADVLGARAAEWWPTGLAPANAAAGPLPGAFASDSPCEGHALDREGPARTRLPLWDGPFLLAFASPGRDDAARVVEAFAAVAAHREGIDLVVLGRPDPALERLARKHDLLARIHCVGRAPREAECCWLQTAVCTLISTDEAVSGGLLLRAMATGHPLVAVDGGGPLQAWLERERLCAAGAAGTLAGRLEAALEGGAPGAARARAIAARFDERSLAARAAALIHGTDGRRRRAA